MAVSDAGYAVSSATSAHAFTFSGRSMGQGILDSEDHNITSVALNTNGRHMVIDSVTLGLSGVVDWYSYPEDEISNGEWKILDIPSEMPAPILVLPYKWMKLQHNLLCKMDWKVKKMCI